MAQPAKTGNGAGDPAGVGDRIVEAGDCLMSIAAETGHLWQTIWNHPQNAQLKAARGVPHVLLPGDRLFVPAIERKTLSRATDKQHKFVRKGTPLEFVIRVSKEDRPRTGEYFVLNIEGRITTGNIGSDGLIRCYMLPTDRSGTLLIGVGEKQEQYSLAFGVLDPVQSRRGMAARLRHLGMLGSDDDDETLSDAIAHFQRENTLPVTGKLDGGTAERLVCVHGS